MSEQVRESGSWTSWDESWRQLDEVGDAYCLFTREEPQDLIQFWQRCYANDLTDLIEERDAPTLLELGSGRGTTSMYMSSRGFTDITLVDLSSSVLEIAAANFRRFDLEEPKCVVGNVEGTELKESSYDVIYNIGLLEHFKDVADVLAESFRLLAVDGLIFMVIVPEPSIMRETKQTMRVSPTRVPRMLVRRVRKLLRERNQEGIFRSPSNAAFYRDAAKAAGFSDVKCIDYNPYWPIGPMRGPFERATLLPKYLKEYQATKSDSGSPKLATTASRASCFLLMASKPSP